MAETNSYIKDLASDEADNEFRNILLRSPSIFLILKEFPRMVISFGNEPLFRSWGKGKEIIGKTLLEVLPELRDQPFPRLLQQVFDSGETHFGYEERARLLKDGKMTDVYYNYEYQANYGKNGSITGVTVTAVDITCQVEKKMAAEKKTRELFQLVNHLPALLWTANANGQTIYYNDHIKAFSGQVKKDDIWIWEGMVHKDDLKKTQMAWKNAVSEKTFLEIEHKPLMKDGSYRWHLTIAEPLRDEHGSVSRWIGTTTDIHDQMLTSEVLKLAKEQLELIFRNVPAAISIFTETGEILGMNERSAKLWGLKDDETPKITDLRNMVNRIASKFAMFDEHGNVLSPQNSATALSIKTREPAEVTAELVDKSSRQSLWLLSRSAPLFDQSGRIKMILNIATDITAQKLSEQAIRQSEKRFRTLIDAFPQMAWTSDRDGKPTYFNHAWYEQTGLRQNEAWVTSIEKALHPDDRNGLRTIWKNHLKTGKPLQIEARITHIDQNDYNWYMVRSTPVRDENGLISQWISTCTNIQHLKDISTLLEQQVHQRTTDLEILNAKLEKQARELKISNEDLQQFAYVASHDLKEPVRKIKTYSNRIRTEFYSQFPYNAQRYLDKIERSSERLTDLIDGILRYSSFDMGTLTETSVDLSELVAQVEQDLEIPIREKEATILADKLPAIRGSGILLHQLFLNLLSNALKFSKPDQSPMIRIGCRFVSENTEKVHRRKNRFVEISVSDNGIGFDLAYADKIFKTFTRLNPKETYEGTGLGLALCKKIVERHNGKITVESQVNMGSVFRIQLPA